MPQFLFSIWKGSKTYFCLWWWNYYYYISLPLFKKTLQKQNFLVLLLCSKKILENFMKTIKVGYFFFWKNVYHTNFLGRRKKYMWLLYETLKSFFGCRKCPVFFSSVLYLHHSFLRSKSLSWPIWFFNSKKCYLYFCRENDVKIVLDFWTKCCYCIFLNKNKSFNFNIDAYIQKFLKNSAKY